MASFRQRGNTWQARVSRKGFPPEVRTFLTRAEAKQWATQVESAMARGLHHSTSGTNALSFSALLDRYAEEVSPTKRGGPDEVTRIHAIRRRKIGSYAMTNLTPDVIARFRDERLRSVRAGAVIRDLALISSVINHARREWGLTVDNPCELVRKPASPPGRTRVLSAAEEARLLAALQPTGRRNPWALPAVQLAIETAMRRGELLALEWRNVDFENRTALLPLTKNGDARIVPLSARAIAALETIPGPREGKVLQIRHHALHAAFKRALRRAGVEDLHFHDLRHTAATRMATKLPNVIELAAVTGHRTVQMLKRYYHPAPSVLARKLD